MEIRLVVTKNYVVQGQKAVRAVKGNLGDPCTFENMHHDYVIVNVLMWYNSSLRHLLLEEQVKCGGVLSLLLQQYFDVEFSW